MTYWSKDYMKRLHIAGDHGALSVIFGSHHTSMPSISSVKVGDVIYPVTLAEGTLCIIARLPVEKIETGFNYLMRETGQIHSALVPDGFALEHTYTAGGVFYMTNAGKYEDRDDLPKGTKRLIPQELKEKPHKYHQEPQSCCAALAASGAHGSMITVRPLPLEVLPELRFGPAKSEKKPLKLNKNEVPIVSTLSGFLRCMSADTQRIFESVFANES